MVVRGAGEPGPRKPNAYTTPSCVVTNTLPFPTAKPEKCVQPGIASPLDQSSLPVVASSACRIACSLLSDSRPVRSCEISPPFTCSVFSPVPRTKSTPPAMAAGSGTAISDDIQAGWSSGLPLAPATTLNAMMLPLVTAPCVVGNRASLVGSPQDGT